MKSSAWVELKWEVGMPRLLNASGINATGMRNQLCDSTNEQNDGEDAGVFICET
jgi:hypothetical protein